MGHVVRHCCPVHYRRYTCLILWLCQHTQCCQCSRCWCIPRGCDGAAAASQAQPLVQAHAIFTVTLPASTRPAGALSSSASIPYTRCLPAAAVQGDGVVGLDQWQQAVVRDASIEHHKARSIPRELAQRMAQLESDAFQVDNRGRGAVSDWRSWGLERCCCTGMAGRGLAAGLLWRW